MDLISWVLLLILVAAGVGIIGFGWKQMMDEARNDTAGKDPNDLSEKDK